MSLLPDPDEIDAIADRISAHAVATRTRAHRLTLTIAAIGWQGLAARTFELAADDIVHGLRLAADRLDDAATTLHRHAAAVRYLIETARSLAVDSTHSVADLARSLRDGVIAPDRLWHDAGNLVDDTGRLVDDTGRLVDDTGRLIGVG